MLLLCVRLSVCPSVCLSQAGIVPRITETMSCVGLPWVLSWRQSTRRNSNRVTPNRAPNATWFLAISATLFRRSTHSPQRRVACREGGWTIYKSTEKSLQRRQILTFFGRRKANKLSASEGLTLTSGSGALPRDPAGGFAPRLWL